DGHSCAHPANNGQVRLTLRDDRVDETRDVVLDGLVELLHRGGGRHLVDRFAGGPKLRRVELDRDVERGRRLGNGHRQARAAAFVVPPGRARVVVTGRLEHRLITGENPIAAMGLGPGDRGLLAELTVDGHVVLGMLGRVVVEVDYGTTLLVR